MKRIDGTSHRREKAGAVSRAKRFRRTPELVALEDRRLLSTFTVTSTADTVTNGVPASGTLRWAVEQADQAGGANTIAFNSTFNTPQTITLEQLGSAVEITAATGPGTLPQSLTIDGPGAGLLTINGNSEGGVFQVDQGASASISGVTITGGSLGDNGAIDDLGSLTLTSSTITANTISGVYVSGTATISNCTITGNSSYSGAGVFVKGGTATISSSTLSDNTGAQGGGVCDQGGTVTVTDCTISGDSTLGGGGGLYNSGQLKVYGGTLVGDSGSGAAVFNDAGTIYLKGTTISGSSGFIDGGGLDNQYGATMNVVNCTITGGTAQIGAGLYNAGKATLTDCTISNNDATFGYGGGISNGHLQNKAVLVVTDCTIMGNTCKEGGGGLGNWGTATLTDDTIVNNFANQGTSLLASDGGGVDNDGTVTLVACTISGNTTTALGGGLYNGGLGVNLATLDDTIVAANTTGTGTASDIAISSNNGVNVAGSSDLIGVGGTGGIVNGHNGNIVLTTLTGLGLTAPGSYGGSTETMALLPASPALHAGSPSLETQTTDQRGEPLDTPTPDIGAFQSRGFTVATVNGGTPQTAATGAAFANPLAVIVTANNSVEPVAGGIVTFTAPSSGASAVLSGTSVVIGSNGLASVNATANAVGGSYNVTASLGGSTAQASFSLTNIVALTFSGLSNPTITYGTATVTLSGTLASGSMTPTGETVSVTIGGLTQPATIGAGGAFSTTFDTAGFEVSGSPYSIQYAYTGDGTYAGASASGTLTVTKATVTPVVAVANKVYDGTTRATLSGETLDGVIGTDAVSLTGGTAVFASKDAGTAETAHVTGLSLTGAAAGNYQLSSTSATTTATITPAPLTITAVTDSKTYDETTAASATPTYQVAGLAANSLFSGDTFTQLNEVFQSKNVLGAGDSTLVVTDTINDGAHGGNYAVTTQTATGTITPAPLTITAAPDSKTYDGTTSASAKPTVAGLKGTDTATGLAESFDTKDVGNGKTLTVTAYTVNDGDHGANYAVTTATSTGGTIAPALLTITAAPDSKTYDGTTTASATPTVVGLKGSDTVTGLAESFASKDVGTGETLSVNPSYIVNDGDGGADYTVTTATASTGAIAPAPLTITAVSDSKTYDGTTTASASPTVFGLVGADTVAGLAESFDTKDAGNGKTLTVTAYTINDGDHGVDYNVTTVVNTTGTIAPAAVSVSGVTAENKPYDTTTAATLGFDSAVLVGVLSGDTVTLDTDGATGTFASSHVGSAIAVTISGLALSGPQASDYTLTQPSTTASIQPSTPAISWPSPAALTYGAALSGTQLDATASLAGVPVPGTYVYTPAAKTVLNAGNDQKLSVTFTPSDSTDYHTTTVSTTIDVAPARPVLSLSAPGGTFNGNPFAASVSISGVGNSAATSLDNVVPTLTYYDGSGTSGTDLGTTPPTAPGTYSVVARFSGTTDYAAVQSAAVPFTIAQGQATIALAPSVRSAVYGQSVTFVATVTASVGGTPGGTVTFSDDGTPMVTVSLDGSGKATLTTSALPLGADAITATYNGSADFLGGPSASTSESVGQASTQVVLALQSVSGTKKKATSVGLKAEIEPIAPGGGVPTGDVTFELVKKTRKKTKVTTLGTLPLSGGVATLSVKANKVRNKPITIVYSGGANDKATTVTTTPATQAALRSLARPMIALANRGRPHLDAVRAGALPRG